MHHDNQAVQAPGRRVDYEFWCTSQALMSWCLGYTREADEREFASQTAFPQLSTRLDREAPPVQDNPHQVRGLRCWHSGARCVPLKNTARAFVGNTAGSLCRQQQLFHCLAGRADPSCSPVGRCCLIGLGGALRRTAPLPLQVFYAACQGLLYVLCYRLEHLMSSLHPQAAGSSGGGATTAAAAQQAAVLQQMFSEAMPQLLHHRWALSRGSSVCYCAVAASGALMSA